MNFLHVFLWIKFDLYDFHDIPALAEQFGIRFSSYEQVYSCESFRASALAEPSATQSSKSVYIAFCALHLTQCK